MPISIFSFFAGCGFLDLGFEKADYNIAFVNEIYEPFMKSYMFSRENLNILPPKYGYDNSDINSYLGSEKLNGIINKERQNNIVGFIGGPPCPDFSCAGKNKGSVGKHGVLTRTYFELIIQERPDFFLFENVKGLWKTKKHKAFYDEMREFMQINGYFTIEKLINSLEYGVPQERERVIMLGFKYKNKNEKKLISEVLQNFTWGIDVNNQVDLIRNIEWPVQDEYIEDCQRDMPEDILRELTVQYWFDKNIVEAHYNRDDYFKPKQGLQKMKTIYEGDITRKSFKRLHRWRYSPTAAYGNNEVHLHPYKSRRLSISEVLAIQSLPSEFILPKDISLTDRFKTVGNGVPFLVSCKLAESLKAVLEEIF